MESLLKNNAGIQCQVVDIGDKEAVAGLVAESDLVIR